MWFDFGTGKKEKPKVRVMPSGIGYFNPYEVDVEFERKPEYEKPVASPYLNWNNKAEEPKPDTIESLINRLIELGEPKPEVVITGEKRAGGGESYTATIDKLAVFYQTNVYGAMYVSRIVRLRDKVHGGNVFETINECEKAIISILKDRLSNIVTETTTITY